MVGRVSSERKVSMRYEGGLFGRHNLTMGVRIIQIDAYVRRAPCAREYKVYLQLREQEG